MLPGDVIGALLLLETTGLGKGTRKWKARCLLCGGEVVRPHQSLQGSRDTDALSACKKCVLAARSRADKAAARAKVAAFLATRDAGK